MKHPWLKSALAALALLLLLGGAALADTVISTGTQDGFTYVKMNHSQTGANYVVITGYTGGLTDGTLVIPSTLASLGGDCCIDEGAFDGNADITRLEINTVLSHPDPNKAGIGANAFRSCVNLESVAFSETGFADGIGDGAFQGCARLTAFEVPTEATLIGAGAFRGCSALASVSFPSKPGTVSVHPTQSRLKSIGAGAFENCAALAEIEIPPFVTAIGDDAFAGCESLAAVTFAMQEYPDNEIIRCTPALATVGAGAFRNCIALEAITVPGYVESIGDEAFAGCTALTSFGSGAIYIAKTGSTSNTTGRFAAIGDRAFQGCAALANIELHGSFSSLGSYAFDGCSGLAAFDLLSRIAPIPEGAFRSSGLRTATLYTGSVGAHAFEGCASLETVVFTAGVTAVELGEDALSGCDALDTFIVPEALAGAAFAEGRNVAAYIRTVNENIGKRLYAISAFTARRSTATIPSYIGAIEPRAFQSCAALTRVTLPDLLDYIGEEAFDGCVNLQTIDMPTCLDFGAIGARAFRNCAALTAVTLPANLGTGDDFINLGEYAFDGCASLAEVTLPSDFIAIPEGTFRGSGLESITLGTKLTTIGASAFENCPALEEVYVPRNVTAIGDNAFAGCTALRQAWVPEAIGYETFPAETNAYYYYLARTDEGRTYNAIRRATLGNGDIKTPDSPSAIRGIDPGVFAGCEIITSVHLTGSTFVIGEGAFENCANLGTAVLPDYVETLGDRAFAGCAALESLSMPTDLTAIGAEAFRGCESLTGLTVSGFVWTIGERAFDGCASLADVTFLTMPSPLGPPRIESIGDAAFRNCAALASIALPDSLTTLGAHAFDGCASLAEVALPAAVTAIPEAAFRGTAIAALPEGITAIGSQGFANCPGLSVLEIAEGQYDSVAEDAFIGCANLERVCLPSSLTCTFDEGPEVYRYSRSGEHVTIDGYEGTAATVAIPETLMGGTVTAVKVGAFASKPHMETLIIPPSITSFGMYDSSAPYDFNTYSKYFLNCTALKVVYHPGLLSMETSLNNKACGYLSVSYVVSDGEATISNCTGHVLSGTRVDLVIPAHLGSAPVTVIGGVYDVGAIHDKPEIASITLPETVRRIEKLAFSHNSGLKAITLNEGLHVIGDMAFKECPLEGLELPSTVRSIGQSAFISTRELASLTLPASLETLGPQALPVATQYDVAEGSTHFKAVDGAVYSYDGATLALFPKASGIEYAVPEGVTAIAAKAFANLTDSVVTLPAGVNVASDAFDTIGAHLTIHTESTVPVDAWYTDANYGSLAARAIIYWYRASGDGYTFVGYYGYEDDVVIPDTYKGLPVTAIGNSAFNGRSALKTLALPSGITSIGMYAFSNQGSLAALALPGGITAVDATAFNNCPAALTCPANSETARALSAIGHDFSDPDHPGLTLLWSGDALTFTVADAGLALYCLPDGVAALGDGAFAGCGALNAVVLPASVADISDAAFDALPESVYAPAGSFAARWAAERGLFTFDPADSPAVVALISTIQLRPGETLDVSGLFRAEAAWLLADASVTLSVEDPAIAALDGGVLTAAACGDTMLVAALADSPEVCARVPVGVHVPVARVELSAAKTTLAQYEAQRLTAVAYDADGEALPEAEIALASDSDILHIDETGLARGLAAGAATVTARAENGATASIQIEVRAIAPLALPQALSRIEAEAFAGDSFEAIVIPAACAEIGAGAFRGCEGLIAVIFEGDALEIAEDAFEGCGDLCFVCPDSAAGIQARATQLGFACVTE